MKEVLYPGVSVKLLEEDGNAFFILSRVVKALRRAGVSAVECQRYRNEATSGDYDHMLAVMQRWVEVE